MYGVRKNNENKCKWWISRKRKKKKNLIKLINDTWDYHARWLIHLNERTSCESFIITSMLPRVHATPSNYFFIWAGTSKHVMIFLFSSTRAQCTTMESYKQNQMSNLSMDIHLTNHSLLDIIVIYRIDSYKCILDLWLEDIRLCCHRD